MSNRLKDASSPYLRQHRDNPVHWYQWGTEAFEAAKFGQKPILLSVGYSACHWCHVMAHESFEDPDTAAVMNELFVNVKVDREERPDVDAIYMEAVQALTGRGGWPMTVFLTPEGEPFYAGTYFPRETFVTLMRAVDDAWRHRRQELQENVTALITAIGRSAQVEPADTIDARELLGRAVGSLRHNFDGTWGGFGGAPKFPSTFNLDLLMHTMNATGDEDLYPLVRVSLDAMAAGGMHDHLAGGFARYSVDERWLVPHFEKMLYDQALLARVYLHSWQTRHEAKDLEVLRRTIDYVLNDLRHEDGGFFSAEDADSLDSQGHPTEGAFYTWTPAELEQALGTEATDAAAFWGVTEEGNFESRSILHRMEHRDDIFGGPREQRWREALLEMRAQRPRPGLDDKVLTEWNAMMLSTLCEAAQALGDPVYRAAAVKNAEFLVGNLRGDDGRWKRSWQSDATPRARHDALAHDLAHLVDAMTRMYELTAEHRWLEVALDAAHRLREEHWDQANGGFFTVSSLGEQLVVRHKDLMDNATPSANSTAALAFLRLGALVDEPFLQRDAVTTLHLLGKLAPGAPSAFGQALATILMNARGLIEVVLPGDAAGFRAVYSEDWRPNAVLAWGDPTGSSLWLERHEGSAYVCRQRLCQLPTTDPARFRSLLNSND